MKEDTSSYVMAISLPHLNLSQSPAVTSAGAPGDTLSEEAFGPGLELLRAPKMKGSSHIIPEPQPPLPLPHLVSLTANGCDQSLIFMARHFNGAFKK